MTVKREGTNEELVQWAIANGHPARPAGIDCIKEVWVCGTRRAKRIIEEAARRMPSSDTTQVPGELAEIKRHENKISAEVVFQTKQGEEPTLAEALENPKLKRALAAAEIDLDDFEIVKFRANSWDVAVKLCDEEGVETLVQRTNHQFAITWQRRHPEPLVTALEKIIARLPDKDRPVVQKRKTSGNRMVEIALYDIHFGLQAWAAETGENYDIHIAPLLMADATQQIIVRTEGLDIEYFLLPIGNDYLHVNNMVGQTPQNRNQLDVDTRLARIITEGEKALQDTIDALAKVAPVKIFWIPGNHDPQTSYYLLRVLAAWYRNDANVEVDVSPKTRKVHLYGRNLIGFMHGSDIANSKVKALAGLLADEAADLWAPDQYREIHKGHLHRKGEMCFTSVSTEGGVVVRTIPSLVGTDFWHFTKGFVATSKTAQFFIWSKHYGLESVNDVHVDISLYQKNGK